MTFHEAVISLYTHVMYSYVYVYMFICMCVYPPTPAASRGSASEEALLATRGEERKLDKQGRPQALHCRGVWAVLHCHWALRGGPLTGAVQHESQLQEDAGKLAVGSAGAIRTSLPWCFGSRLARSALHCHGVLALRGRPLTGASPAVQEGGPATRSLDPSCAERVFSWHVHTRRFNTSSSHTPTLYLS